MRNIVLNIPHSSDGKKILDFGWNEAILPKVEKWTDWHTDKLFAPTQNNIKAVIFPYSRFICDVERLIDDPMEEIGQGIVYTEFEGVKRNFQQTDIAYLMQLYSDHINKLKALLNEDSILIDCHSFPSELSDIDVCIGFNEDWSKPTQELIDIIRSTFEKENLTIGINEPYSNSISPQMPFAYQSIMIELNKKIYLDTTEINTQKFGVVKNCIEQIYKELLK